MTLLRLIALIILVILATGQSPNCDPLVVKWMIVGLALTGVRSILRQLFRHQDTETSDSRTRLCRISTATGFSILWEIAKLIWQPGFSSGSASVRYLRQ